MKITSPILLVLFMQLAAFASAQNRLTLTLNDVNLENAISLIEQHSDYHFVYNNNGILLQKKITASFTDATVQDVLQTILAGTAINYKVTETNLVVLFTNSISPKIDTTITGKITDENGAPLRGASIQIKGKNTGTSTNAKGEFFINVSSNDVLIISYVGYENQQIAVADQTNITTSLIPSKKIADEVVVVGYGTQRKIDVTGAVASVKGAELAKQPVTNAAQAIQGKVAGVQIITNGQPGTSPQIMIRGNNTMLSSSNVLYVVDGVLTDDISNINTTDILTMDVLKDASSTAIYGARGANGVVIVTTKKGIPGKIKISYNDNVGIRQATHLVKMADAVEYANYASAASGLSVNAGHTSTDWFKDILHTAFEQNHSISLSGGSDNATYFLSAGYLTEQGIIINNIYKRFTIRSNNEFKISDKIKVGMQASFTDGNDHQVNFQGAYNDAYRAAPILAGKINGKYGNTSSYQNVGNPILDINNQVHPVINNRIQGDVFLEFKPITGLTFRSSLGGDLNEIDNKSYTYQFNADTTTFLTFGGNQLNPQSILSIENQKTFRWVWDNTLTYNKRFGNHNITALIGTTAEQASSTDFSGLVKNVPPDPNLWYLPLGNLNTSQIGPNPLDPSKIYKWARNSYLARVNYNYKERYLLTATIRADGSSQFPSQNRWAYFPSVGAGWIISKEEFMQSQHIFNSLKLRASYGQVGNDGIPAGSFSTSITPNLAYPFGGGTATPGSAITNIVDPNIKWEITTETDVAIEFITLRNRLSGEINYYNKQVNNALINVPIPSTAGSENGFVLTNAAKIQNKGVEVTLNWADKITKDITYHIGGNISFNKNKVLSVNGGLPVYGGAVASQGFTTESYNGHAIGSFYLLKTIGVFQSQSEVDNYKNVDGTQIQPSAHAGDLKYAKAPVAFGNPTGSIDLVKDEQYAGSYQPKAYFGINLGITYKKFDLSIDGYGVTGNQVYNGKKAFRLSNGAVDNIESYQAYARWTPSNHSQSEPAANKGNLPASTYFLESGSFIRINNLTLGYKAPDWLLHKIHISGLRVFATSQNLFTHTKYSGFTPELPGGPVASGIETNVYPTSKTYAIGVNLNF